MAAGARVVAASAAAAAGGAAKESVWSYPRPPRLEPCAQRLRVLLGGQVGQRERWGKLLESHWRAC